MIPSKMDSLGQKCTHLLNIFFANQRVWGLNFYHQRGLWPRDPLSPLLFVLVADTLQAMLIKARPHLYSIPIIQTSAYQSADDIVIITEAHPNNLKIIKHKLGIYAEMSGLHINFNKSIFVLTRVPERFVPIVSTIPGCPRGNFLINYLGLPLTIKRVLASLVASPIHIG